MGAIDLMTVGVREAALTALALFGLLLSVTLHHKVSVDSDGSSSLTERTAPLPATERPRRTTAPDSPMPDRAADMERARPIASLALSEGRTTELRCPAGRSREERCLRSPHEGDGNADDGEFGNMGDDNTCV